MELRTNGSIPQSMPTGIRSSGLQDLDLGKSNSLWTVLCWSTLILVVAAVPAFAAFVLMGSVPLAVMTGLITVGGIGLAALMI
ncbi:hypothetical protein EGT67_21605 [Prescottella agglutinans]|uniref:Uncharacterized protein n=1 Tax=Prescottella agglutinans TaxID=1644129 RepID=A0A438B9B5_9NOCA|nr:hypothetical protein EGT67_21605 [Prescottella agglutinans]